MITTLLAQAANNIATQPYAATTPIGVSTASDQAALGIFGAFATFFGFMILIALIIWIWALIDVIRREFTKPEDKTLWLVVVIILNTLGAIIYLIVGRSKGTIPTSNNNTPSTPSTPTSPTPPTTPTA